MLRPGSRNLITDVDGILVGNEEDQRLRSGVSVVLCERPSVASVDVRGGAPGTRDTDLLDPSCRVDAHRRDLPLGRLGLRPVVDRRRHALAARARPRRRHRRRRRADRAHRHPVRPAERRRQAVGLAALSRDGLCRDGQGRPRLRAGQCRRRPRRQGRQPQGRAGQRLGGRSDDRPSGRRAGGRECARLHDDGRHAAVLGLGAGAEQGVRRPAAAGARAVARGEPRSRRPQPRSGRCRAQRPARQHHHRRRRHQRPPRQGLGQSPGGDGAGRAGALDPPGAHAAGRRHGLRRGDRHATTCLSII